jgi:dienelactone hydrolase
MPLKRSPLVSVAFLAFLSCYIISSVAAGTPPIWADLEPGPYAPGFKTIELFDDSRTFRPKRSYFGTLLEGERSRPIQILIWYPADPPKGAEPIVYGAYDFPYPADNQFMTHLSGLQARELYVLFGQAGPDPGLVQSVMSVRMAAYKDAPPVDDRFPLIVYHPDGAGGYGQNAVLCEYLASRGYVVATTHAVGARARDPELEAADLEAMVRDLEFVWSHAMSLPYVAEDRLGLLGYGLGGASALLMQMRNTDVDAVVSLRGDFFDDEHLELLRTIPSFDISAATVPIMHVCAGGEESLDSSFLSSLTYADRYLVRCPDLQGTDCNIYGALVANAPGNAQMVADTPPQRYTGVCRQVTTFFDLMLKDQTADPVSTLVEQMPQGASLALLESRPAPPTEEQFMWVITESGVDTALAIYAQFKDQLTQPIFRENTINALGYRSLQAGSYDEAMKLLRLNTEAYPQSANVWDSYAESCEYAAQMEEAERAWRKVLETLPDDVTTPPQLKITVHDRALEHLVQLGADKTGLSTSPNTGDNDEQ